MFQKIALALAIAMVGFSAGALEDYDPDTSPVVERNQEHPIDLYVFLADYGNEEALKSLLEWEDDAVRRPIMESRAAWQQWKFRRNLAVAALDDDEDPRDEKNDVEDITGMPADALPSEEEEKPGQVSPTLAAAPTAPAECAENGPPPASPVDNTAELESVLVEVRQQRDEAMAALDSLETSCAVAMATEPPTALDPRNFEQALDRLRAERDELLTERDALLVELHRIETKYARLRSDYASLQADHGELSQAYAQLQDTHLELRLEHDELLIAYRNLHEENRTLMAMNEALRNVEPHAPPSPFSADWIAAALEQAQITSEDQVLFEVVYELMRRIGGLLGDHVTPSVRDRHQLPAIAQLSSVDDPLSEEAVNLYTQGQKAMRQQSYPEAIRWYLQAARLGSTDAMNDLGYLYARGLGALTDHGEAFGWFKRAAEGGHALAMLNVANAYEQGIGTEPDEELAWSWYAAAAERGNAIAAERLARP